MAVAFVPKGTGWGPCKRGSSPKSKAAHKDADCYYQDGRESELHCGGTMTSPYVGEAREKGEGKLARPAERQCANTATNAPPHSNPHKEPSGSCATSEWFLPGAKRSGRSFRVFRSLSRPTVLFLLRKMSSSIQFGTREVSSNPKASESYRRKCLGGPSHRRRLTCK